MYRGSSIADANSLLTDSSLCSLLGVKNLRLRNHPISHKPHAILRRVESSDDSSDEDDKGDVVYFRLYSQKSFNVKAGRELLLTVDCEDNRFKDRAVLFEGIPKSEGSEDVSDEGTTQVEEEPQIIEEEEIISTPIMPPKMRRHWNKKTEEVSPPVVFKAPVVTSSVGVQVELHYVSSAVQATLEQNNVSVQVQPCQNFASVQATSSHASRAVQVHCTSLPNYASLDVQTDLIFDESEATSAPQVDQNESASATSSASMHNHTLEAMEVTDRETQGRTDKLASTSTKQPTPNLTHPCPHTLSDMCPTAGTQDAEKSSSHRNTPPFTSGGFIVDFLGQVQQGGEPSPVLNGLEISLGQSIIPASPVEPQLAPVSSRAQRKQQAAHRRRARKRAKLYAETQDIIPMALDPSSHTEGDAQSSIEVPSQAHGLVSSMPSSPAPVENVAPSSKISLSAKQKLAQDAMTLSSSSVPPPPPDPKTLVRIPAGSSFNPLSIRPSPASRPLTNTSMTTAPKARKPVIVGRGWPFVRDSNPVFTPEGGPPAAKVPSLPKSDLSNMVAYSSPPSSPSPPPAKSPERSLAESSQIDYRVPNDIASDEAPVDMDISAPSSPITQPSSLIPLTQTTNSDCHIIFPEEHITHVDTSTTDSVPLLPRIAPPAEEKPCQPPSPPPSESAKVASTSTSPKTASSPVLSRLFLDATQKIQLQSQSGVASNVAQDTSPSLLARMSLGTNSLQAPSVNGPAERSSQNDCPLLSRISVGPSQKQPMASTLPSIPIPSPSHGNLAIVQQDLDASRSTDSQPPLVQQTDRVNSGSNDLNQSKHSRRWSPKRTTNITRGVPLLRHPLPPKPPPPLLTPNQLSSGRPRPIERERPPSPVRVKTERESSSPNLWASECAWYPSGYSPSPDWGTPPGIVRSPSPFRVKAEYSPSPDWGPPPGIVRLQPSAKRERRASPDLWTAPGIVRVPSSYNDHSRGVKRERPPSPSLGSWIASSDSVRLQQRQSYKPWPTISCVRSVKLGTNSDSNSGLGIERIAFNSDGSYFALSCADLTLRIWNNRTRVEVVRLACHSPIVGLAWLDNDAGVMSLSKDGRLGKWARLGPQSQWHWGEMINLSSEACVLEDTMCLACTRDRIAVAFQRTGVRVWIWGKGSWIAQRSITRTNITTLRFIDGGNALLGGTREGVVALCSAQRDYEGVRFPQVQHVSLPSILGFSYRPAHDQALSISIAVSPTGMQALVAHAGGSACMVELGFQCQQRIGKSFEEKDMGCARGAVFAAGGKTAVFGSKDGCVLVWDVQKGGVVEGLEVPDGDTMQTVVSHDGPHGGGVVGGTRQGRLVWWPEPQAPGSGTGPSPSSSRKRAKVS